MSSGNHNIPFKLDELRLIHARRNFDSVSIDENGNAVIGKTRANYKPFDNTIHFTLNAVVSNHQYGGHFDACHCVMISRLRETVELGNSPKGMSPADTYFHRDQNNEMTVARPVFFAPEGMEVPKDIEPLVRRYPRGVDDKETYEFKYNAILDMFNEEYLPLTGIDGRGWKRFPDYGFHWAQELLDEMGVTEYPSFGLHDGSSSERFAGSLEASHETLAELRAGKRWEKNDWNDAYRPMEDIVAQNTAYLDELFQRFKAEGDQPRAEAFFRRKIDEYNAEREAVLAALPPLPPKPKRELRSVHEEASAPETGGAATPLTHDEERPKSQESGVSGLRPPVLDA